MALEATASGDVGFRSFITKSLLIHILCVVGFFIVADLDRSSGKNPKS